MGNTSFCETYKTKAIQDVLRRRGITRLCHITEMENLFSILTNNTGILANEFLKREKAHINDVDRLDGKTDFISTSMQYPNVWYYNYKKNSDDWAIIFIDTDICRRENTLFSPVNAATARGAFLGTGVDSLRQSFDGTVNGRLRPLSMLSCCPTDDQAEVMIHREIPTSYIRGIAFETVESIEKFTALAMATGIQWPPKYLAPELFTTSLSKKIRLGIEPDETIVKEESDLWQKGLCS